MPTTLTTAAVATVIHGEPVRTVAPVALPVDLAEAKLHARIDGTTDDALLTAYLNAATEEVERYTGLGLITQTWRQTWSAFPALGLALRRRPVQAPAGSPLVQSVTLTWLDADGAERTIDPSAYRVSGYGQDMPPGAVVRPAAAGSWPAVGDDAEAVRAIYRVGYGDAKAAVPYLIRQAIYLTAATWYNHRENVLVGASLAEVPWAARTLLRDWRPLALG